MYWSLGHVFRVTMHLLLLLVGPRARWKCLQLRSTLRSVVPNRSKTHRSPNAAAQARAAFGRRLERRVRPWRFADGIDSDARLSVANAARISARESVFPATTSRRDRSIKARNPGCVLSARLSLSTFRSGTIAANGRFRLVSKTTSSSSSLTYSASERDAVESARVFIS